MKPIGLLALQYKSVDNLGQKCKLLSLCIADFYRVEELAIQKKLFMSLFKNSNLSLHL